uniref:RRM domain-containing protein n=1 Tax=Caenorhabditis japonica TaxID=281687 RepID=A0A8R1DR57_CAEJA
MKILIFRSDGPSRRYRRDDNADPTNPNPSIVVHVRNLHLKVTEADLLEALSNFGPVAYATCIPHSRMALVEFEDIEGAKACVNFAASNQINVGGQSALFNYSTSQCIERMGFESATPNKVLVVTVLNAQYPIDADVIYQISNAQGKVLRVAVMHKPTVVQALVEFEDTETAKTAKHAMNGADIYSGCCTLKVEFAKPDHVRVTRQDKDQRDFTLPDSWFFTSIVSLFIALIGHLLNESVPFGCLSCDLSQIDTGRKTLIPTGPDDYCRKIHADIRETSKIVIDRRPPYDAPERDRYFDNRDYPPAHDYPPRGPPTEYYDRPGLLPSRPRDEYDDRGRASFGGGGPGCVLMVYGIEHEKISCDMLFNILCQYGNVLRISFMRTKQETGMIEMGTPDERQNVLDFLQGFELFGIKLEFKPSHQECVHHQRDPFLLPDGSPSFRDFSASRNQRFTTPELAAKNRIIFPTNVLHWFNAPGTMDEEALRTLIAEKSDHKPVKIEIFPSRNERSSAGTAEFPTIEQANEVISQVNHLPVDSPYGSAPFIVKWAYATPRRWDGSGGEAPRYDDEEGGNGERREGIRPAARPSPSIYRGGRGRGGETFRRESYAGGLYGGGRGGGDRFNPYPPRGGYRGGRGRGRFDSY